MNRKGAMAVTVTSTTWSAIIVDEKIGKHCESFAVPFAEYSRQKNGNFYICMLRNVPDIIFVINDCLGQTAFPLAPLGQILPVIHSMIDAIREVQK